VPHDAHETQCDGFHLQWEVFPTHGFTAILSIELGIVLAIPTV